MNPASIEEKDRLLAESSSRPEAETDETLIARSEEQDPGDLAQTSTVFPSSAHRRGRLGFVVTAHDSPENTGRLITRLLEQGAIYSLH